MGGSPRPARRGRRTDHRGRPVGAGGKGYRSRRRGAGVPTVGGLQRVVVWFDGAVRGFRRKRAGLLRDEWVLKPHRGARQETAEGVRRPLAVRDGSARGAGDHGGGDGTGEGRQRTDRRRFDDGGRDVPAGWRRADGALLRQGAEAERDTAAGIPARALLPVDDPALQGRVRALPFEQPEPGTGWRPCGRRAAFRTGTAGEHAGARRRHRRSDGALSPGADAGRNRRRSTGDTAAIHGGADAGRGGGREASPGTRQLHDDRPPRRGHDAAARDADPLSRHAMGEPAGADAGQLALRCTCVR